ncbi:HAMP domain-containing histidine kinase [Candidatus Woesebacteria bacterium]|nr:HAMP domain-containing histidine kinase [Candidatus Woesebacteria bacterium]
MHNIGLSTKLIFTVGILASVIVTIATLVIGILVYVQTEQQIQQQLAQASQQIISEHLMGVNGNVVLQKKDEGASLVVLLRNMDMSLYIASASGASLAKYGIYRNINTGELASLFSEKDMHQEKDETYKDVEVAKIGRLDVFTAPLRSGSTVVGYIQLTRVNYIWPVLVNSLFWALMIQLPITWIVSAIVIRWGTQTTLAPLRELVKKVEAMKVDELPETFSLSSRMDHDVRVLTETLQALISRVRSSLTRQREMAQNLSHEFKTPLARVNARLSLMRPHVKKVHQKTLDEVIHEMVGLGEQVDGLLDVAIHEISTLQSKNNHWKLQSLCRELIQSLPNPSRVMMEIPSQCVLPIPIGLARTLLRNILENAAKYGPAHGRIVIKVTQTKAQWRLIVINASRAGIESSANIFVRHYRGLVTSSIQGHGLGMAIVRDICKQLGIEVRFIATDPDNIRVELSGNLS